MAHPNYYAILPADVRYDKRLKPMEKIMYAELTALSNKDGFCSASNQYFADLYEVDQATVSRWIAGLSKCGYVSIILTRNESKQVIGRQIFIADAAKNRGDLDDEKINTPIDEKINTLLTKKSIGIDKKVKENNTRENNTSINNPLSLRKAEKIENEESKDDTAYWQEKYRDQIAGDRLIFEHAARFHQIDRSTFDNLLSMFFSEMAIERKRWLHYRDCAKHFTNWTTYAIEKLKKQQRYENRHSKNVQPGAGGKAEAEIAAFQERLARL